jgi:hypothetical protein
MNWTKADLKKQFARIVAAGWLPVFQRQARRAGTTTAHLLGIGSRETNLKNIKGDWRDGRYNGFGPMQVDVGTDANYAAHWSEDLWEPGVRRGAEIWRDKMADTLAGEGKTLKARSKTFVGAETDADDARRIATAAYNCGRWAYYHFSRRQHIDSTTTGRNYSRDVYDRAVEFAEFLEQGGYETGAIQAELEAQGKYARNSHRDRFSLKVSAPRQKLAQGTPQDAEEALTRASYHQGAQETLVLSDESQTANSAAAESSASSAPTGQKPDEPATQVTPTGWRGWWGEISGASLLSLASLKAALNGEKALLAVAVIAVSFVIVAVILRKAISEAVNKWIASDPNRFNVR